MIITTVKAIELWYSEHINVDRIPRPQPWIKNDKVSLRMKWKCYTFILNSTYYIEII